MIKIECATTSPTASLMPNEGKYRLGSIGLAVANVRGVQLKRGVTRDSTAATIVIRMLNRQPQTNPPAANPYTYSGSQEGQSPGKRDSVKYVPQMTHSTPVPNPRATSEPIARKWW